MISTQISKNIFVV